MRYRRDWGLVVSGRDEQALGHTAAAPTRDEAVYDQHAARMYQQALLTLGDAGLAEQVVSDVITEECLRPARDLDGAQYRLGIAVRRRCQQLATDPAWWNRISDALAGQPGCISPARLGVRERAALALVIFGQLGYAEAADEMAIPASDMAALLLAVLHKLTAADLPV